LAVARIRAVQTGEGCGHVGSGALDADESWCHTAALADGRTMAPQPGCGAVLGAGS
jgi:hypothetical protein